jgi:pantothenate kinase
VTQPHVTQLAGQIAALSDGRTRRMIAIAGAPGSGKSTIVAELAKRIPGSAIVPMDGFHQDNDTLTARGRLHRKGAPDTFDTGAMLRVLQKVARGGAVSVPVFDRGADAVVPDGALIPATADIILVEGNYLLLDTPGWREMHEMWDLTVLLDVSPDELRRRLVRRWTDHDLTPQQALDRAASNDLPNAQTVMTQSIVPDIRLKSA